MGKESSDKSADKSRDTRRASDMGTDGGEKDSGRPPKSKDKRPSTAFDLWLQRELQKMFSGVSREPVPDELLRLIDEGTPKPK